ncbi:MAG TPA: hypothetical protein VKS99_08720 [Blastocatellia bacterium]|nr:hypothetical protein [Blastocatellia bacterium]
MFCPGCGIQINDDLKFCRQCGANLHGVRDAMTSRPTKEKFDWSKTRWAEMIYPEEELERMRGVTPGEKLLREEKKRLNEIRGGIITSLVGVGVMVFLYFFFDVVARQTSGADADLLRRLWMTGIIPFLVGVGLLINGFFVSRRLVRLKEQLLQAAMSAPRPPAALPAKATDQLVANASPSRGASVTEDTTAHLPEPVAAPPGREID